MELQIYSEVNNAGSMYNIVPWGVEYLLLSGIFIWLNSGVTILFDVCLLLCYA